MTTHDDFDRTLAGLLHDASASSVPAAGLDGILDLTRGSRPRAAWTARLGSDWVGPARTRNGVGGFASSRPAPRWAAAALLLLGLVFGGAILMAGQRDPIQDLLAERGRLAYILDGAAFLANPDGTEPARIGGSTTGEDACDAAWTEGDMWSPDGRHLAYRSGPGKCQDRVHVHDMQGREVASWTAGIGWTVAWAPDSQRVATWALTDTPNESLGGTVDIRGVDGVLQAQVTLPSDACVCADRDPMWTHDGTGIVLLMQRDINASLLPWRFPMPNGPVSPLALDAVGSLAFSADGEQALKWSDGSISVTAPQNLSSPHLEVEGEPFLRATWSPANDRIASLTYENELVVLDVARAQLTSPVTGRDLGLYGALDFTPDGERIMFTQVDGTGTKSLWTIAVDGSDARELVHGAEFGDWQPQP